MKNPAYRVGVCNTLTDSASQKDPRYFGGFFWGILIFKHIQTPTLWLRSAVLSLGALILVTLSQIVSFLRIGSLRQRAVAVLIALALLLPICATAQEVTKERTFEGDALYGFMNGGSDLFFEYGFRHLTVRELTFEGFKYTMEIYRMDTPVNAFGIYSLHIFKPLRVDSLVADGFDCLSRYQLQAAVGNEYISIVFNDGEKTAGGAEKLLAQYLDGKKGVASAERSTAETASAELTSAESTSEEPTAASASIFPPEVLKLPRPFTGHLRYIAGEISLSQAADDVYDQYPCIGTEYTLWCYTQEDGTATYLTSLK